MATHDPTAGEALAALAAHEFVVLTTYRKSGIPVPTTVWFAYDKGKVYITTRAGSGKLKRIRNDRRVTLAPSDRVGTLLGEPEVAGHAREALGGERARANAVLAAKYGEAWTRIVGEGGDSPERAYIAVE
jgi:PPOX class probable F420-dependent enzyme